MTDRPELILASKSPRRAELLRRLGLDFRIVAASVDEAYVDHEMPADHAERLAREKAVTVAREHPSAVVIGCDTIVIVDSDVLGKPRDEEDALQMLRRLSGREHEVMSGVAVAVGSHVISDVERVRVRFRRLDDRACEAYLATGESMDKAGAYGIQGFGAALVESIDGDYYAVVGLPVVRTLDLVQRCGWNYAFAPKLEPQPTSRSH